MQPINDLIIASITFYDYFPNIYRLRMQATYYVAYFFLFGEFSCCLFSFLLFYLTYFTFLSLRPVVMKKRASYFYRFTGKKETFLPFCNQCIATLPTHFGYLLLILLLSF